MRGVARAWILVALFACGGERAMDDGAASDTLTALLARGEEAYWNGEHAAAMEMYGYALRAAEEMEAAAEEVVALTWLGLAAYRLGDYERAVERLQAAVDRSQLHELYELEPRAYNALGLVAVARSRLAEAAGYYEKTLDAARRVDDVGYRAKAGMNLGLVYTQFGEFDRARRAFEDGVDGGRALEIPALEIRSLVNLAMLETRTGHPDRALEWLRRATELDIGTDPVGEEAYWGQMVSAHLALGTVRPALTALDSALRMSREQGLREPEAANLALMAEIHAKLGDHRRAIHVFEQALAIQNQLGLDDERAEVLRAMATIYAARGNFPVARDRAEQALAIHQAIGAPFAELDDRLFLAELTARQGEAAASEEHLSLAHSLARMLDVRRSRVEVALAEARIADLRRQSEGVIRAVSRVADDLALGDFDTHWQAYALEARALARRGDMEGAARSGRKAVSLIGRAGSALRSSAWRASFLAERNSAYADLVTVLLEIGRIEEAFEVADGAREPLVRRTQVGESSRPRQEKLLSEIDALVLAISEAADDEDQDAVRELSQRLEHARRQYEIDVLHAAEQRSAGQSETRVTSASVRSRLGADDAIVEFMIGDGLLIMFIVRQDSLLAFRTAIVADDLLNRVRLSRELLATPGDSDDEAHPVLGELWRTLLGPGMDSGALQGVKHIITVPHGVLTYVPFAALRDPVAGRYLAEVFSLSYAPSAAALATVAGPWEDSGVQGLSAFAPLPDRLPASLDEVAAIGSVRSTAAVVAGRAATEQAVRDALASSEIVHVASHAVLNVNNPLFSRIELARQGGEAERDGRLEVHEVLAMEVRSRLVFLSGCETGAGVAWTTFFDPGEDYATLALAFLGAGAAGVIATLWPIEDVGAARFATLFYERLREERPAAALVAAQRAMLGREDYSHPYYWAGYRISGSDAVTGGS